jgi:hypothetical protein
MAAPKGNKFAKNNKGGRPTAYRPEFAERVKNLCQLGAIDVEIADFFGVTVQTIHNWRAAHQEFFEATRVGKEHADKRVERSFYQRACGYEYESVKVVRRSKNGVTVTETSRHVPGDVTAQMKWLCNRRPNKWREKVDVPTEREPEKSAAELRAEIVAKLIEWGVIVPDESDAIEGETTAAADEQTQGTRGVAIADGQSGDRRRSYSRYPRPSKLRGAG